jgi:hypothetical protein
MDRRQAPGDTFLITARAFKLGLDPCLASNRDRMVAPGTTRC